MQDLKLSPKPPSLRLPCLALLGTLSAGLLPASAQNPLPPVIKQRLIEGTEKISLTVDKTASRIIVTIIRQGVPFSRQEPGSGTTELQIAVDADLAGGSDSAQSYIGLEFDLRDLPFFRPK